MQRTDSRGKQSIYKTSKSSSILAGEIEDFPVNDQVCLIYPDK